MQPEAPLNTTKSSRPRRVGALLVGLLVLCSVVGATFIFLKRSGVQLQRSSTANISGVRTNSTELTLHNTQDDCWMAIHGVVYDLTSYGPRHPAGDQWIWDRCGMEATADYDRYHKSTRFLIVVSGNQVGTYGDSGSQTTTGAPQGGNYVSGDDDDDDGDEDD